jgi:hypothetical protein
VKGKTGADGCDAGRLKANSNTTKSAPYRAFAEKSQPRVERKGGAAPPPDPFAIGRLGSAWSILGLDSTKKRGLGRCLACGIVREITVVDGIPACDCSGSRLIGGRGQSS